MSTATAAPDDPLYVVVGHGGDEFKFALLLGTEARAIEHCEELNAYQQARPPAAEPGDKEAQARLQDWTLKHPGGPLSANYDGFKVEPFPPKEPASQAPSVAAIEPGVPIYVVSAEFDTHQQLLGWYPNPDTAERIRAAMQAHHDQKPELPEWLNLGPIELQAARTALTNWVAKHPCGIDAERCRGFVTGPVEWLDVSTWGTPA